MQQHRCGSIGMRRHSSLPRQLLGLRPRPCSAPASLRRDLAFSLSRAASSSAASPPLPPPPGRRRGHIKTLERYLQPVRSNDPPWALSGMAAYSSAGHAGRRAGQHRSRLEPVGVLVQDSNLQGILRFCARHLTACLVSASWAIQDARGSRRGIGPAMRHHGRPAPRLHRHHPRRRGLHPPNHPCSTRSTHLNTARAGGLVGSAFGRAQAGRLRDLMTRAEIQPDAKLVQVYWAVYMKAGPPYHAAAEVLAGT